MKKNITQKVLIALFFVCACISIGSAQGHLSEAKTYTSAKQIKKELKSINKRLPKAKKEYKEAEKRVKPLQAKSKKELKGSLPVFLARIVNGNPLVISYANSYYRVSDASKGVSAIGLFTGSIRVKGGYSYVNGYTCANAVAVKSSVAGKLNKASKKLAKKKKVYDKLVEEKKKLKKTLTYRVPSRTLNMDEGKFVTLSALCTNKYYNKVKWTSSNPSVLKVGGGVIKAMKGGKATLTAVTSISKKKTKITVNVKGFPRLTAELNKSSLQLLVGDTDYVDFKKGYYVTEAFSSNPKVVTVECGGGEATVKAVGSGTAVITVICNSYTAQYTGTCTVKVDNPVLAVDSQEFIRLDSSQYDKDSDGYFEDKLTHQIKFRSNLAGKKISVSMRNEEDFSWDDGNGSVTFSKEENGGAVEEGTINLEFYREGRYKCEIWSKYTGTITITIIVE